MMDRKGTESNDFKGAKSVKTVAMLLRGHGYTVKFMPTRGEKSPYDLLVNWNRVEVKVCPFLKNKNEWQFNIHRHGSLDESMVDVYILRLEKVPGFKAAIHLVIPSPIGQKVVHISLRSLLARYGRYYNRFDLLGGKDKSSPRQIGSEIPPNVADPAVTR